MQKIDKTSRTTREKILWFLSFATIWRACVHLCKFYCHALKFFANHCICFRRRIELLYFSRFCMRSHSAQHVAAARGLWAAAGHGGPEVSGSLIIAGTHAAQVKQLKNILYCFLSRRRCIRGTKFVWGVRPVYVCRDLCNWVLQTRGCNTSMLHWVSHSETLRNW